MIRLAVNFQTASQAWSYFHDLKQQRNLGVFLDFERKLLSQTRLEPAAVDLIVNALRHTIDLVIERPGRLDANWRETVEALAKLVCDKAAQEARDLARRPLLRRALLAAGGSTVSMLNLFPPFVIAAPLAAGSVSVGIWLIGFAAEGVLDDWVG